MNGEGLIVNDNEFLIAPIMPKWKCYICKKPIDPIPLGMAIPRFDTAKAIGWCGEHMPPVTFFNCGHTGSKQSDGKWRCNHGGWPDCKDIPCERCDTANHYAKGSAIVHSIDYCWPRMNAKQRQTLKDEIDERKRKEQAK